MSRILVCDLLKIFKSGINAVLPENLIKSAVKYDPANQQLIITNDNYNLNNKNLYLIGAGKAVLSMAREIENILGNKIKDGIISIPVGSSNINMIQLKYISYYEGAKHNLPDVNAELTTKKIIELVNKLGAADLLLVLISGGGSALLPLPKPPITLDEKLALIKCLAKSGADIKELNIVRKKLSDVKGGELAKKAQPAQVISLILSDVVGDPVDLIASGPTVENEEQSKAIDIIAKYNLTGMPESIKATLSNANTETQFPRHNVRNYVIGSNKISIAAALEEARSLNYLALSLSDIVTGNIKDIATEYMKIVKLFHSFLKGSLTLQDLKINLKTVDIPGINTSMLDTIAEGSFKNKDLCLILGGEITIEVKGSGKGGRNQQLALEFSSLIDREKNEFQNSDVLFLSGGTDGIDGPTDAAGAIGYLNLIAEAKNKNFNVQKYLDENNSYNFYKAFNKGGFHVITGHTNTNVMDIHIILIKRK